MGLVYLETDTLRMYMKDRQLQRIWTPKNSGTMYPMTQIPPSRYKLPNFAWFDYIRPVDKHDIFNWRGKKDGTALKTVTRHAAPLQQISGGQVSSVSVTAEDDKKGMPDNN